jgi:Flp pilus assembly protein CpaB
MAEMTSTNDVGYVASVTQGAKRSVPNVSSGRWIMILSGLLAAVIFLFATAQSGSKTSITIITKHIDAGETISADAFGKEGIQADRAQLDRMIRFDDHSQYAGFVATTALEPGDIVMKSMILRPSTADGRRSMSIAVDKAHAVNGNLKPGDRIDLIDASVTPAFYVVQNIEVLDVSDSDSRTLGATSGFSLAVSVDAEQAAKLATTIKAGKFDVIRTTGSTPAASPTTQAK